MCGIAGYISLNAAITPDELKKANLLMTHRGPDADGFYFDEENKIGLAHRRLSIIDLSSHANQPMISADGRYVMVYNGEVYNFQELKNILSDSGKKLKTTSDTEVILELFAQKGTSFFSALNGMFAFAIYDKQEKVLTLCRDHAGIKPLFYFADENTFAFASELKSVKAMVGGALPINKSAIPYFLHVGFVPEPATIYQNTFKFKSAHYVQISLKNKSLNSQAQQQIRFWSPYATLSPETMKDESIAKQTLNDLLLDAVEKQLISDVPIGTFLSGGIDSSLVTSLAAKIKGKHQINSFSIAIDDGKYNEAAFAKSVSDHIGSQHHEFVVKEKEIIELADKIITAYDEPFADSSAFPTMMVSRLARKHVTVALSGDGGDELFHGYGMYKWAQRLSNPIASVFREPIYQASKIMNSRYQRIGQLFNIANPSHLTSHIFSQEQYYFKEQELQEILLEPAFNFDELNQPAESSRKLTATEKQSWWDFDHYLKDDLLVKVDRASMQYSLESRVPLLDYRVIEFSANLDSSLKMKNGTMKYLLKEVLYDYVPKELFDRPKWGFSIPLAKWLKSDLKYLVDRYTSKEIIEKHGILNPDSVNKLKNKYFAGTDYLYNRLWTILILHWWLEENN